jgi:REP element-mobilizing transposase RayT
LWRACTEYVRKWAAFARPALRVRTVERMPVAERVQEPGAFYQVGVRGARQLQIEFDDRDRRQYVRLLAATVRRFRWRCVAWCLMPNHVHLLIQITETNLSNGMYLLNHSYARWLNRRHGYSGHAFDRRFYADHIETEPHLYELVRYTVLNPVRAGLCPSPEEWPWSSHRAMLGLESQQFVDTTWLLGRFGRTRERAIASYVEFVADGLARLRNPVTLP